MGSVQQQASVLFPWAVSSESGTYRKNKSTKTLYFRNCLSDIKDLVIFTIPNASATDSSHTALAAETTPRPSLCWVTFVDNTLVQRQSLTPECVPTIRYPCLVRLSFSNTVTISLGELSSDFLSRAASKELEKLPSSSKSKTPFPYESCSELSPSE